MAEAQFIYEPLANASKQLRLLQFTPAHPGDEVGVEMSTWSLSNAPPYMAVSYTWGDPEPKPIMISGQSVDVRWNCFYALYQARFHYPDGYVWIDSICINQDDPDEKAIQVSNMFDIYSNASMVLASLGEHGDDSKALLDGRSIEHSPKSGDHQLRTFRRTEKFGSRPYWSRLWIVQELFAAKDKIEILCGSDKYDWAEVTKICGYGVPHQRREIWDMLGSSMFRVIASLHKLDLNQALSGFTDFDCSDPRDRLYGLLALIRWPAGCEPVKPDYKRSAYDLALQLVDHVKGDTIEPMLRAFRLSLASPEVETLVTNRQLHAASLTKACVEKRYSKFAFITSDQKYTGLTPIGCLVEDGEGNLTSALLESLRHIEERRTRDDFYETFRRKNSSESEDFPREQSPRKLTVQTETIGLLCAEAMAGDLLVICSRRPWSVLLVLRHNDDSHYDLVGQGIFINVRESSLDWEAMLDRGCAALSVSLTAEDKIALVGQDVTDAFAKYEVEAYFKRLVVRSAADTKCAAQILWGGGTASSFGVRLDQSTITSSRPGAQTSAKDRYRLLSNDRVPS
ncbi:hypothetical protein M409DRAFT_30316 [Zasmidium cellare ATCC 36951]|uniref:Heterokaryon incompatibility domain-containing protein n=1 Tax=Zasmidium cellare ATCC 36951 TaxID=1080233 RepID=A0A6A6BWM2_ZASCE|nr:uncharacterized protein M409DRAFT_30316 [Zasmidium cellare ATCC 36951]KAF2159177.1 hypothetical protein M409DRAFT_30316 [Zasmidium cellare ATCC 36951]